MDSVLKLLKEIKGNMHNGNIEVVQIKKEEIEFESRLPFQTVEDFLTLDNFLLDDFNRDAVVSYLQKVGGISVEETVKRMLVRLLTNEVAVHFSWQGKKGKRVLQDLQIFKVMRKVVCAGEHKASYTDKAFEIKVKEWFRCAKTRVESKKKVILNSIIQV